MNRIVIATVYFAAALLPGRSANAEEKTAPVTGAAAHSIVNVLMKQELPENAGHEVRMLTVEYPPGVSTSAHTHPGAIFAYVLEGAVICQLDEGNPTRYEAGQSWYERPGQVHRISKNASATERAKLLVFFVTEPDKPVLETVK